MGGEAVRDLRRPDRSISGEWLCAPLDVEQGGIGDDSVFAEGTWTTTAIVATRR